MNNKEKVRRAFSPLAANPETVNAVMAAASTQPQRRPVRQRSGPLAEGPDRKAALGVKHFFACMSLSCYDGGRQC